ncbi:hypothetical protein E3U23_02080 [Erythrobacter litoralis]|uniref:hypothetical protein n=1 Tax=Erythrobacter litoralis TaxID=39960 RepID=UPI0024349EFE|nr:hypothetical protein [Erythrobacter litoralis]MDG6077986.1 hypothetical protein [Erythrobacter litoralis]
MRLRAALGAALSMSLVATAVPAHAGSMTREGFAFPADGDMKIVVFRPDVHVGSLKVGGMDEPNAEWTEQARVNIQNQLQAQAEALNAQVSFIDELEGENAELLTEYRGLFEAVSGSVFQHVTQGDSLDTKKVTQTYESGGKPRTRTVNTLDWTLGPGAAQLKEATGADYAMFVFTHDSYGDAGRKAAQAVGMLGCIIGACVVVQAGVHVGYAGLVNLETGNIVWFNTDMSMGGDPRKEDGAQKRVGQLMEGFPMRNTTVAIAD